MSDVSELVKWLRDEDYRGSYQHLRGWDEIDQHHAAAADALETLAGEVERLRALVSTSEKQRYATCGALNLQLDAAESRLAKLAPVVEAAKRIADPWAERQADDPATIIHLANIARQALATMGAAND